MYTEKYLADHERRPTYRPMFNCPRLIFLATLLARNVPYKLLSEIAASWRQDLLNPCSLEANFHEAGGLSL
jgi:hypothetical protein